MVAASRRALLLRVHRFRLRPEDLEDCYGQATLELIRRAREGACFQNRRHIAAVLEQRFLSRINDRRRALSGRSAMQTALEGAIPLGGRPGEEEIEIVDRRSEVERVVLARDELQRVRALAERLSADQRLVLAAQLADVDRACFCAAHGWSAEKYRKVAQRGRARLRRLLELDAATSTAAAGREESPAMRRGSG